MTFNKKVLILGRPWLIKICTEKEEPRLKERSGFADWTSRLIAISDPDDHKECDLDNMLEFLKKVARHEIIHAFMFGSGLAEEWKHDTWGQEETLVDWLAFQLPAICDVVDTVEKALEEAFNGGDTSGQAAPQN